LRSPCGGWGRGRRAAGSYPCWSAACRGGALTSCPTAHHDGRGERGREREDGAGETEVRARRGGGRGGRQPPPPRAAEVGAVAPVCIGRKRERQREERVRRRI
jgi:hypothetical protein